MRGWQRNRIALGITIIIGALIANIASFTQAQIISLEALLFLLFYLYVRYKNSYKDK